MMWIQRLGLGCALFALGCEAAVTPSSTATNAQLARPRDLDSAFVAGDFYAARPGALFQLFAIGGAPAASQMTFCNPCLALEGIPSADRTRVALRRVSSDTNKNGRLDEGDRVSLVLLDLARQIEGPFLPDTFSTQSADWSATGGFLVHSSTAPGGTVEDLYNVESNAQNNQPLLSTPAVRERSARINPAVSRIAYERIDGVGAGKSEIWIYQGQFQQARLTSGAATAGELLPGTLYLVGSDTGPAYSPDSTQVAFRRLVSTATPGGAWDIMAIGTAAGSTPRLIAGADSRFRSNPDWNKEGIVFTEVVPGGGGARVVVVDPTTGAQRVLHSIAAGFNAGAPRWISK